MVLCFGLVTKTVLITHIFLVTAEQCLNSLKVYPAVCGAIPRVGWGCTRNWERILPGPLTPADKRNDLYHTTSRSGIKAVLSVMIIVVIFQVCLLN